MNICITGGAGFIAFHLANKLKSAGHQVSGFDNFNDYYDPKLKYARVDELEKNDIYIDTGDLQDKDTLAQYFEFNDFDIVMHLAAYAGVRHSLEQPDKYIHNNVVGTHNLIEACQNAGIKKVVYASTSCVMAGNNLPWSEDEKLGYQLNPYGYTKATNESQFMASTLESAIGLRFFTVYGPWGRPDMALFDFTNKIVNNETITLFNHGDMIRDFTYVDDIVQGIEIVLNRAMNNNVKEIYNIGYGEQVKLLDFVEHIEFQLGRTSSKKYVPKHPADTYATWSDTSKLQALGYKPTVPIDVGVTAFINWYKSYYGVN